MPFSLKRIGVMALSDGHTFLGTWYSFSSHHREGARCCFCRCFECPCLSAPLTSIVFLPSMVHSILPTPPPLPVCGALPFPVFASLLPSGRTLFHATHSLACPPTLLVALALAQVDRPEVCMVEDPSSPFSFGLTAACSARVDLYLGPPPSVARTYYEQEHALATQRAAAAFPDWVYARRRAYVCGV